MYNATVSQRDTIPINQHELKLLFFLTATLGCDAAVKPESFRLLRELPDRTVAVFATVVSSAISSGILPVGSSLNGDQKSVPVKGGKTIATA